MSSVGIGLLAFLITLDIMGKLYGFPVAGWNLAGSLGIGVCAGLLDWAGGV